MDPIKTAVKYALVPLRLAVELGERYVGEEQQPEPPSRQKPRAQRPRSAPDPQASQAPKSLGDAALARKVESVIFRDPDVPKGAIVVNAAQGVIWLRGEAKTPQMIKGLESQTRDVPEVVAVENLLHLPKTPAPTRI